MFNTAFRNLCWSRLFWPVPWPLACCHRGGRLSRTRLPPHNFQSFCLHETCMGLGSNPLQPNPIILLSA
uniref:Uncharacterized protein n=1 Tax=Scleropages formosus TaxID=113540 RepID=A0A8C9RVQ2_SCLFO